MEAKKRKSILKRIVSKGGLMAVCAKLYLNDEVMGHKFIIECAEQCRYKLAIEYWGNKLVFDIIEYGKQFNEKSICNDAKTN